MGEARRKFDQDFKEGAARLVRDTGRPIAQVARDPGINEGTLGNWVDAAGLTVRRNGLFLFYVVRAANGKSPNDRRSCRRLTFEGPIQL